MEFEKLRTQGQTTNVPGVGQVFTKDIGGIRSWLYDHDLYFRGVSSNTLVQDFSGNGLATGLKFTRPGGNALFIQEIGVRRASSPDSRQIWLRGAGSYNTTLYDRLDGSGQERNWSAYALADYQVYQPDARMAYKGVYLGASALFAKDSVNVYKRSLEARVYALGLVPGRPAGQVTVTVGLNSFSRAGARAIEQAGDVAHNSQFSVGALCLPCGRWLGHLTCDQLHPVPKFRR